MIDLLVIKVVIINIVMKKVVNLNKTVVTESSYQ